MNRIDMNRFVAWMEDPTCTGKKQHVLKRIELLLGSTDLVLQDLELNNIPKEIGLLTDLTSLDLSSNWYLRSLPAEIGLLTSLRVLDLNCNSFTLLPAAVCQLRNLKMLTLQLNKLTSLPAELGNLMNLERLHVDLNWNLAELPLSLGQLPRLTEIAIDGTKIDPLVADAILNQCRMMRNAEAVRILPARLAKWEALAKNDVALYLEELTVDQKITLNEWLLRLERTRDFAKNQTALASTVCGILKDLLRNWEFRDLFFNQAEANNTCCEDRAAMSLNEIFTYWKLFFTRSIERVKMMVGVAKTLRLRKHLQKLINRDELESVEIFLYYETLLRQPLQLVTAIQHMAHGTIGRRDWIDEASLVQDVQENYFEELIEMPLFEKMMEKQLHALNEEFQARLGEADLDKLMEELRKRKIEIAKQWIKELI